MRFYSVGRCYYSQIEAWAVFGLRIGYSAWGLAWWPANRRKRPWWMPHLYLTLWSHTGQCDRIMAILITIQRFQIGFCTPGDATPELMRWSECGLTVRLRKVRWYSGLPLFMRRRYWQTKRL